MIKILILTLIVSAAYAQYNEELSKELCEIAVAAYCKPVKLLDWSCGPCKKSMLQITNVSLIVNSTAATMGFIAVSQKLQSIIVAFRGSDLDKVKNWVQSLSFISTSYPLCDGKCRVHEGFYHAYQDINTQFLEKIKNYKTSFNLDKIIIFGHGLGAALATHAVAHLTKAGIKVTLL
jgi:predicted lipase